MKKLDSTSRHHQLQKLSVLPTTDQQKSFIQTQIAFLGKKVGERQRQSVTEDQRIPNLPEESSTISIPGTAERVKNTKSLNFSPHPTESCTHWVCLQSLERNSGNCSHMFNKASREVQKCPLIPGILQQAVSIPGPQTMKTCCSSPLAKLLSFAPLLLNLSCGRKKKKKSKLPLEKIHQVYPNLIKETLFPFESHFIYYLLRSESTEIKTSPF